MFRRRGGGGGGGCSCSGGRRRAFRARQPSPRASTHALERSSLVDARCSIHADFRVALVNVNLAILANVPSVGAIARVRPLSVSASCGMHARRHGFAFVDLLRAHVASVPSIGAIARVRPLSVGADAVVGACGGPQLAALVHIFIAVGSLETGVFTITAVIPLCVFACAPISAEGCVVLALVDVCLAVLAAVARVVTIAFVNTKLVRVYTLAVIFAHCFAAFRALVNVHARNQSNVVDCPPPIVSGIQQTPAQL